MNTQESVPATEPEADHLKVPASTPRSKPNANNDLRSLPMPEAEKQLGSSPDGLTQAEAQKRLTQYGPNEIEENELYERRGRREGLAGQDWFEAEHEIRTHQAGHRKAS